MFFFLNHPFAVEIQVDIFLRLTLVLRLCVVKIRGNETKYFVNTQLCPGSALSYYRVGAIAENQQHAQRKLSADYCNKD